MRQIEMRIILPAVLALFLSFTAAPKLAKADLQVGDTVTTWVTGYDLVAGFHVKRVTCKVVGIDGPMVSLKRTGLFNLFRAPFDEAAVCVQTVGQESSEMAPATASLLKEKSRAPDELIEAQSSPSGTSKQAD
jgi:catabolite regulation protein CreA